MRDRKKSPETKHVPVQLRPGRQDEQKDTSAVCERQSGKHGAEKGKIQSFCFGRCLFILFFYIVKTLHQNKKQSR